MRFLTLIDKEIDLENSEVLFNKPFTKESLKQDWETHNSEWQVEDGWLTGKNPDESAGMAITKKDYHYNIVLEFEGRTVLPSSHDIDFMWNGEWDKSLNSCGTGYIGGINGWWSGRVGIEKSPGYKLRSSTRNFMFTPGKTYKIHAGSIDGNCFIFIDGMEILELIDPEPINYQEYGKIAFTAWSSHIQIRNLVIRKISWKPLHIRYPSEF